MVPARSELRWCLHARQPGRFPPRAARLHRDYPRGDARRYHQLPAGAKSVAHVAKRSDRCVEEHGAEAREQEVIRAAQVLGLCIRNEEGCVGKVRLTGSSVATVAKLAAQSTPLAAPSGPTCRAMRWV